MADPKTVSKPSDGSPSPVDAEQTLKAAKALVAHIKNAAKDEASKTGKRNLLDVEDGLEGEEMSTSVAESPIWLTVSTKRHIADSRRLQPSKVVVPHPLNTHSEATICLITADPQRAYKNIVASDEFPAALRKRITRVVDLAHLTKKFRAYEAQRKLFAEHDVFLADDRIINRLPKALGKTFYKSTVKRPIAVTLHQPRPRGPDGKRLKAVPKPKKKPNRPAGVFGGTVISNSSNVSDADRDRAIDEATSTARSPVQIAAEIERAIGAAVLNLAPTTNTAIKIGYAGWPAEHLAANVDAVLRAFVDKYVPQKWANVKGVFVKGTSTSALPIWQTDELWLKSWDVLGAEEKKALEARNASKREKANIGKKRKAVTSDDAVAEKEPSGPKEKKKKTTAKLLPESNDNSLDQIIKEQKAKLQKQKNAAKKAMDL